MPVDTSMYNSLVGPQPQKLMNVGDAVTLQHRNRLAQLETQDMERQAQGQNALRGLYKDPANFGPGGQPTPDAIRRLGAEGGDAPGLTNDLLRQQTIKSTMERNIAQARKADEEASQAEQKRWAESILPIGRASLTKYNELIKKGVPIEEALKQTQAFYDKELEDLEKSGVAPQKFLNKAKQARFNPYAFQVRVGQFENFLGTKNTDAPRSRELKRGNEVITQEWDSERREWKDISKAPRSTKVADGSGPAASGGLPKGVVEYVDLKSNKRYGVGKGLAYELGEDGKWEKIVPNKVPQKIVRVGSAAAGQGAREAVFTQRMFQAANQASYDMENIANSPINVSSGILGSIKPERVNSFLDAGKTALANQLTEKESQVYNVKAAGLQRTLAAIEAAGLMPSGQLVHQMDAVIFRPGDYQLTKLHKLAQARQIVESGIEVMNANPRVSDDEKALGQKVVERMRKAVPFTHKDLDELDAAQARNPKMTMRQLMKQKEGEAKGKGLRTSTPEASTGSKNYSAYWNRPSSRPATNPKPSPGGRGSAAPKGVEQSEDKDDDADNDKE